MFPRGTLLAYHSCILCNEMMVDEKHNVYHAFSVN